MFKRIFGFLSYLFGVLFILSGFFNLPHLGVFLTGILMSLPLLFLGNKLVPFKKKIKQENTTNKEKEYRSEKTMKQAVKESITTHVTVEMPSLKKDTYSKKPTKKYDYIKARKLVNNITVLDFETTGFSQIDNEIIQIGAIKYVDGIEVDRFSEYSKPSKPISSKITKITGITNEIVSLAPPLEETLVRLSEFLKKETLVAHNASFDMKFLLENYERNGIISERYRVVDTLSLARKYIRDTENHKLPTLKKFLELEAESHDAIGDCFVTGKLYYHCKAIEELTN